jgi:hypothetical protein
MQSCSQPRQQAVRRINKNMPRRIVWGIPGRGAARSGTATGAFSNNFGLRALALLAFRTQPSTALSE